MSEAAVHLTAASSAGTLEEGADRIALGEISETGVGEEFLAAQETAGDGRDGEIGGTQIIG